MRLETRGKVVKYNVAVSKGLERRSSDSRLHGSREKHASARYETRFDR